MTGCAALVKGWQTASDDVNPSQTTKFGINYKFLNYTIDLMLVFFPEDIISYCMSERFNTKSYLFCPRNWLKAFYYSSSELFAFKTCI